MRVVGEQDEGTYRWQPGSKRNDGHLVYFNSLRNRYMYFMADTQVWAVSVEVATPPFDMVSLQSIWYFVVK